MELKAELEYLSNIWLYSGLFEIQCSFCYHLFGSDCRYWCCGIVEYSSLFLDETSIDVTRPSYKYGLNKLLLLPRTPYPSVVYYVKKYYWNINIICL
jgi:hypothetical protein